MRRETNPCAREPFQSYCKLTQYKTEPPGWAHERVLSQQLAVLGEAGGSVVNALKPRTVGYHPPQSGKDRHSLFPPCRNHASKLGEGRSAIIRVTASGRLCSPAGTIVGGRRDLGWLLNADRADEIVAPSWNADDTDGAKRDRTSVHGAGLGVTPPFLPSLPKADHRRGQLLGRRSGANRPTRPSLATPRTAALGGHVARCRGCRLGCQRWTGTPRFGISSATQFRMR